jgi:ketosteroid isomerase-like protein
MRLWIVLILLILVQTPIVALTVGETTSPEKEIRSALNRWVEAANRGDYKAAMDVWSPELIGWPSEGEDDTYALEKTFAANGGQVNAIYSLTINEIVVDKSMALVRDTWQQTITRGNDAGKTTVFRSFEIWRLQPDRRWRITRWIDGPEKVVAKTK